MLINFCQKRMKSTISCSAVSNDGYEVTNLINDSDKGFLAYSCIKPPIHIDLTFICDIKISRVLLWPSVGAQKSSGFELCVKSGDSPTSEYKKVSMGFLDSAHRGISFYRRDITENSLETNPNFLQRFIQVNDSQAVNKVRNLRISILKTENSVPAIGHIQVWGRVSQSCGRLKIAEINDLWNGIGERRPEIEVKPVRTTCDKAVDENEPSSTKLENDLNVPESYLDPITWTIMIQPIVLPSGVTIDQSTLEKHAKTEATWGRSLSDPFTGMPFSESRRPKVASALKARIDKFLLDNKHSPDVMKLPRISGHKQTLGSQRNRSINLSKITSDFNRVNEISNSVSSKSHCDKSTKPISTLSNVPVSRGSHRKMQTETRVHRLPVIPMCAKRAIAKRHPKLSNIKTAASLTIKKPINSDISRARIDDDPATQSNLDRSVQNVLSTLQRFDEEDRPLSRKCLNGCACDTKIFYKLPCNHVVCKDVIASTKNRQCGICGAGYSSRDPERVHSISRLD